MTTTHWTEADSLAVEAIANGEAPGVILDPDFVWWCNLPEPEDTFTVRSLFDRPQLSRPYPPASVPAESPQETPRPKPDWRGTFMAIGALGLVVASIVVIVTCLAAASTQ